MSDVTQRDERKVSVYLSDAEFDEIRREAHRLDRSISWVLQRAWIIARGPLQQVPGAVPDFEPVLVRTGTHR